MNKMDTKIREWLKDLDEILKEIDALYSSRISYLKCIQIINLNRTAFDFTFFPAWLNSMYGSSASSLIRRLVDKNKGTYSLVVLLKDIRKHSRKVTRKRFINMMLETIESDSRFQKGDPFFARLKDRDAREANRRFTKLAGNGDWLQKDSITKDLHKVVEVSSAIKDYVDQYVAHNDRQKISNLPKYTEIKKCLTAFVAVLKKYEMLLAGRDVIFASAKQDIETQIEAVFSKKLRV